VIAATVIDFVANELVSRLLDKGIEELRGDVNERFSIVEERLSSLEEQVEWALAAPLKAALIHLKSGELEKARDNLILADAGDPHAAAAKWWLAVVLAREGRQGEAAKKMKEALLLNPFVGQYPRLHKGPAQAALPKISNPTHAPAWTTDLSTPGIRRGVPRKLAFRLKHPFVSKFSYRSSAAVTGLSMSGGRPAIQWLIGSDLNEDDAREGVFSTFDATNGATLWSKLSARCVSPRRRSWW